MADAPPLVLGVGNPHRHDDAVGLAVAARVAERMAGAVRAEPFEGDGVALLDRWADERLVVVVDALPPRGVPGRVARLEGDRTDRLVDPPPTSTHGVSVGEAWRLGRALGRFPDRLVLFGIEGERFDPGFGLSPAVAAAVDRVAASIEAELRALRPEAPHA